MNGKELAGKKVCVAQVALAFAVMSDQPDYMLDVGVVHGLSDGMYKAGDLFGYAVKLLGRQISRIAVVGGEGKGHGWIGQESVIAELETLGILKKEIIPMAEITNSKEEAIAIVKMARELGFKSVGSISVAYHGGRMFPYMVKAMQECGYWVKYHMLAPPRTDWWMPMLGSQGLKITTSIEAAMEDSLKIEDHIKRGFAAPFDDVLHYFKNREKIVRTQTWR